MKKLSPIAVDLSKAHLITTSPMSREALLRDMAEALVKQQLLMIEPTQDGQLREGIRETPKRVVKAWIEQFAGYAQTAEGILGTVFTQEGYNYDEMILCKNIELYSMCEHHMMPFYGKAHVAYIPGPGSKVVGLSKLMRLVDCFARRLQIQEKLTNQIAEAIDRILTPIGVAVVIEAKHHCACSRGVSKQNSSMVTSCLRGAFKDKPEARAEFLQAIKD